MGRKLRRTVTLSDDRTGNFQKFLAGTDERDIEEFFMMKLHNSVLWLEDDTPNDPHAPLDEDSLKRMRVQDLLNIARGRNIEVHSTKKSDIIHALLEENLWEEV